MTQHSVRDYSDVSLVRRAVRNAGRKGPRQIRWAAVADAFALGSTYAMQLCRLHDCDPHEQVGVENQDECAE